MRIQEIPLGNFHTVAGVFGVKPIIQGSPASVRRGRRAMELIQREGDNIRVVAVSDDKAQLLSFAALNGLAIANYTNFLHYEPTRPDNGSRSHTPTPEIPVHEIPFELM